jgi:hypothetical protein
MWAGAVRCSLAADSTRTANDKRLLRFVPAVYFYGAEVRTRETGEIQISRISGEVTMLRTAVPLSRRIRPMHLSTLRR